MAIALVQSRSFTNTRTGEIVKYDFIGIAATVDGEYMELPLKNLDAAEKIAFKMIATGANPADLSVGVSSGGSVDIERKSEDFFSKTSDDNKINLDEED